MQRSVIAICALLATGAVLQQSAGAAETTAADDAIRRTAQEFIEAYDHGDAAAVAAQWVPDGEYIIGERSVRGREAIAKLYADFFREHPGSQMKVKIDSIRLLAPTVAIEQGTASVSNSPNGPPTSSAYTAVHVKQGNNWLMANVREEAVPSVLADTDLSELSWLVGAWSVDGDAAKAEITYEWMANKHFLRGDTTVTKDGNSTSGGVQIIGRDPESGRIVSWFFNADGGHGYGEWYKEGPHWIINTRGTTADGVPTTATNVLYRADNNVMSWQSMNRAIGETNLPDQKEIVIERIGSGQ